MIEINGENIEVIDVHVHLGVGGILRVFTGKDEYLGSDVIARMDRMGVDRCVAFPSAAPQTDYSKANELIAEQVKKYTTRVIGFGRVNPNFGVTHCVEQINKFAEMGLKGLKLHAVFDFHIPNGEYMHPIYRAVKEHNLTILCHAGLSSFCSPAIVAAVAMDFPDIPVIMPHFGYEHWIDCIALAKRVDNLFLDTAGCFAELDLMKRAVADIGVEKIIFGSDDPYEPAERELEKIVKYSGLTIDQLKLVLSGNIKRILQIA